VTQYIYNSLSAEVVQPLEALVLIKENIKKEELGAVFKACGEIAEDKINKVDETELPELSVEEVIRMGLFAVPTS